MRFDPIADMITIIRNGQLASKTVVKVHTSKFKRSLLEYLKNNGYIDSYKEDNNIININLKYVNTKPKIKEIERISHSGARIYSTSKKLNTKINKVGNYIITTSQGLMNIKEAQKKKLGGEIILRIW